MKNRTFVLCLLLLLSIICNVVSSRNYQTAISQLNANISEIQADYKKLSSDAKVYISENKKLKKRINTLEKEVDE